MERAEEPALRHFHPGLWPRGPQGPVVLDHSSPRTRTQYTCDGVKPHDVRNSLVVHWLGFGAFTTKGPGSVPGLGTEIHKPCTTRTTTNNLPCLEGCLESHGSGGTVVPPTWAMEFCGSSTYGDPARAAGS